MQARGDPAPCTEVAADDGVAGGYSLFKDVWGVAQFFNAGLAYKPSVGRTGYHSRGWLMRTAGPVRSPNAPGAGQPGVG